jgi:hypothetical protein
MQARQLVGIVQVLEAQRILGGVGEANHVARIAGQAQFAGGVLHPGHGSQLALGIRHEQRGALGGQKCADAIRDLEQEVIEGGDRAYIGEQLGQARAIVALARLVAHLFEPRGRIHGLVLTSSSFVTYLSGGVRKGRPRWYLVC